MGDNDVPEQDDELILKPMSEVTDEELERMRIRNLRDLRREGVHPLFAGKEPDNE